MKKLLFLFFVLCSTSLLAQSKKMTIYKKDGSKLENVVYKGQIQDKIIYTAEGDHAEKSIGVSEILIIEYADGSHEKPKVKSGQVEVKQDENLGYEIHPNIISYDYLSPLATRISFSYERIMANGMLGLKLPIHIGTNGASNFGNRIIFGTGLITNFYPMGQRKMNYVTGATLLASQTETGFSIFSSGPSEIKSFVAGYVNNGIMYTPFEHFSFSMNWGIGFKNIANNNGSLVHTMLEMGFSFRL